MNATEDNDETVGFLNDHSSESASGGAPHVVLQRQVHTYSVLQIYLVRGFVRGFRFTSPHFVAQACAEKKPCFAKHQPCANRQNVLAT